MVKNYLLNLQRQNMYAAQAAAFGQRPDRQYLFDLRTDV